MVALCSPVGGACQLLSEVLVFVLLCVPDLRVLLGGDLEGGRIELIDNWVHVLVGGGERFLGQVCKFLEGLVRGLKVRRSLDGC